VKKAEKERVAAALAVLDNKALSNELIKAWQAWEERPGEEYTACNHEAAIQETARRMGVTGTQLHVALTNKKIDTGMSVARTVRLLFKTIKEEKADAGDTRQG
jgi:hypothetical protein